MPIGRATTYRRDGRIPTIVVRLPTEYMNRQLREGRNLTSGPS
jgi:hypothetical protein